MPGFQSRVGNPRPTATVIYTEWEEQKARAIADASNLDFRSPLVRDALLQAVRIRLLEEHRATIETLHEANADDSGTG